MPFEHSFGLVRLRCVLLSGCSALITDGLKIFLKYINFQLVIILQDYLLFLGLEC